MEAGKKKRKGRCTATIRRRGEKQEHLHRINIPTC
jgi:hypothetical protein